ncbi:MAG: peptidoglycan-associated lipoprotein Pal [Ferrovibrio sp.]
MAAVLVLGLAACESAPQQDRSVGGSGAGGGASSGVSTSPMGGVSSGALTREGAQQQFAAEVGDRVLFETDSYSLNSAASATLGKQAAWLKRNAQWRIVIEGHCDERGTREYNLALGDRRAATVRDYLVNQGIPTQRISVISYGKERPVAVGNTESAWAQNRRGVTVLQN